MKKIKRGFTLVEVALFLAVTGALFVGIMVGTQNSIWQQRYNDTVQGYTNFLRNIYAEVLNPQGIGDGRSDLAIYGKLISFGQSVGLDGEELNGKQAIYVYDVVGKVEAEEGEDMNGSIIEALKAVDASVVMEESDENDEKYIVPAGIVESYSPAWNSTIEEEDDKTFNGTILVVRHPGSGIINTLVNKNVTLNINEEIREANSAKSYSDVKSLLTENLSSDLGENKFRAEQVDFCLDMSGVGENSTNRRDIRIVKKARNASGVEIIDLDSEDNKCR